DLGLHLGAASMARGAFLWGAETLETGHGRLFWGPERLEMGRRGGAFCSGAIGAQRTPGANYGGEERGGLARRGRPQGRKKGFRALGGFPWAPHEIRFRPLGNFPRVGAETSPTLRRGSQGRRRHHRPRPDAWRHGAIVRLCRR